MNPDRRSAAIKIWKHHFRGWFASDIAIENAGLIHVLLREDLALEKAAIMHESEILARILRLSLAEDNDVQCRGRTLRGYHRPFCGIDRRAIGQALVVSREYHSEILAMGPTLPDVVEKVAAEGPAYLIKLRYLDAAGSFAYAVGTFRSVFRRVAPGRWERLPAVPGPLSDADNAIFVHGFKDIDAFSPTEMYAAGGHGEVFRFDGTTWHDCGFPTNRKLNTVTCAGDGNVYISGEGGRLWAGRGNRWELVHDDNITIPYNDVLWFAGELWLASDYQLHIWDGQHMRTPTFPGASWPLSGHMDAVDGLLVIAGLYSVYAFDGHAWRIVVERPDR